MAGRLTVAPTLRDFENKIPMVNTWLKTIGDRMTVYSRSSDPVIADVPENQWVLWYNTATGKVAIWMNKAGTLLHSDLGAAATGTVTTVSVVSANGLAGTVANAATTPAITLTTSITGVLKGNGTAISAAAAGTDYEAAIAAGTTAQYWRGDKSWQTLNATAVGLGSVTNDVQTKAAIVPNTAPSSGQILVGNAGGTAYAPVVASGAFTLASTGAATIATPGTLTVSSTNSTVTAHTHAITSSSAPGAAASLLATDASGIIGSTGTRIVKGWFTDLTVTNAIAGSVTGSAATLTTPRAINGTNFDGSAAITVTAAAGTLTGATLNSTVTASSLTTVGTLTALAFSSGSSTGATFTTASSTSTITITDTGTSGANLKLAGNGATTPNKFIRGQGGNLEFGNSAYTQIVMTLTDAGALTTVASIGAHSGTAIPAGGTAGAGLKVSSATNFGIFFGSGAPTLSAAQGSLYLRSDGSSTSTRLYVNTTGSTTWTNVTTAA